jgi:hypothetical protein
MCIGIPKKSGWIILVQNQPFYVVCGWKEMEKKERKMLEERGWEKQRMNAKRVVEQ